MSKSFYVTYPADENVKLFINAIRVIADENQRTQVHITVRGPYKKRLGEEKEKEFSSIIKGEEIQVNSVGNFFESNQNTVFFKCAESLNLKKIWMKTSYKDYNPHITIYDGNDNIFASKIYSVLNEKFIPFSFPIEKLSWLEPKDKEKLELFHLKTIVDFEKISTLLGFNLDISSLTRLSKTERIQFISILSEKLYKYQIKK